MRTSARFIDHDEEATVLPVDFDVEAADSGALDAADLALPIGTRLNEFEILGLIGEGGFGMVYLAQDHALNRRVALKEYLPKTLAGRKGHLSVSVHSASHKETFAAGLRSFINEAQLLAQFDHPSLVKVFRFWEANGTAYLVMPYYIGPTLRGALKTMEKLPDESWLRGLLIRMLDVLAVIHAGNCLHRDIAPDNILLQSQGGPVLLDFGAARRVLNGEERALTVILKPGYAPIEQYAEANAARQGAWTDLYALAGVAYYCLAGKAPLPAVARVMSDEMPTALSIGRGRFSEKLLQGIDKALSLKPADRPQDTEAMRRLLGLEEEKASRRWWQGLWQQKAVTAK